jgi:hypothetical protein
MSLRLCNEKRGKRRLENMIIRNPPCSRSGSSRRSRGALVGAAELTIARVRGSSARSFPQRGNLLRLSLRSSLLSVEKPCPLRLRRASDPQSLAPLTSGRLAQSSRICDLPSKSAAGKLNLQRSLRWIADDHYPGLSKSLHFLPKSLSRGKGGRWATERKGVSFSWPAGRAEACCV